MNKYPPEFKRIHVKKPEVLAEIQDEFEQLWRRLKHKLDKGKERNDALMFLKAACSSATRSAAVKDWNEQQENLDGTKVSYKKPYIKKAT